MDEGRIETEPSPDSSDLLLTDPSELGGSEDLRDIEVESASQEMPALGFPPLLAIPGGAAEGAVDPDRGSDLGADPLEEIDEDGGEISLPASAMAYPLCSGEMRGDLEIRIPGDSESLGEIDELPEGRDLNIRHNASSGD